MYGTWRSVRDVVSMERAQQSYFWGDSEIYWSIEVLNASYFFEWSQTWGPFFISNSLLDLPIWFACIFQGALSSLSWTYRVFLLLHFLLLIFFLKMKYNIIPNIRVNWTPLSGISSCIPSSHVNQFQTY